MLDQSVPKMCRGKPTFQHMGDSSLVRIFSMSEKAQIVFVKNHFSTLGKAYILT